MKGYLFLNQIRLTVTAGYHPPPPPPPPPPPDDPPPLLPLLQLELPDEPEEEPEDDELLGAGDTLTEL